MSRSEDVPGVRGSGKGQGQGDVETSSQMPQKIRQFQFISLNFPVQIIAGRTDVSNLSFFPAKFPANVAAFSEV